MSGLAGEDKPTGCARFGPTRWSLVAQAGAARETASRNALAELYQLYWYPLYAYARRRGFDRDVAADLIQAFFAELVSGSLFRAADQAKGRFRSYLLGALKHFIGREWERSQAQKRGGGRCSFSIDEAESRYGFEPRHGMTPERLFERQWALTLLERVMERLAREHSEAGKQKQFDQLKTLLAGPLPDRSYVEIAAELGTSEGALKVAVHRLRQRYRELLMGEIAQTVATPGEVDDEIKHLYAAISSGS